MRRRPAFINGRHLAAARALAGLKQRQLADLAGLHVNSVKRLERMSSINGSEHASEKLAAALETRGVRVTREPATVTLGT
jgi:transcriptional regulator with XRE-family HTH domain